MNLADFKRRVADLKQSISLRSLIESDGHKITRSGGLDKCCCPFHKERTPSCVIYPDQHFHCFGCCARGDIFSYVMLRNGCDFKTAVETLGSGHRSYVRVAPKVIQRPKEPELPEGYFSGLMDNWAGSLSDQMRALLAMKLGIPTWSLADMDVQWALEHKAWAFPMMTWERKMIGIRLRDTDGKKWAIKGSRQGLFLPIDPPQSDLYVTEGPTDCAAMLSMGLFAIGKAAAMQGPEEIVKFITKNRIRRVIVIADNDSAGLKGAKKLIDVCPVPCCELVLPAKDAREFYRNGGTKELIENLLKSAVWRNPSVKAVR